MMKIVIPIKTRSVLVLIFLNLVMPVSHAQTSKTELTKERIQWNHVIQKTVERHAEYLLYDSQKQLGEGYKKQAKGWLGGDPSVNLLHYNDGLASDQGYREWEAGVELPLWLPGERSTRQRISDGYFTEAEADLTLLTWKVAGKVQDLAWDFYLAEATRKQTYKQWQSALALENNINRRVKAGESPQSDKLLAQQSTLEREITYQAAISQVQQAKNAWKNYTDMEVVPPQKNTAVVVKTHSNDRQSLNQHPLMKNLSARTQRVRAQRDDTRIKRRDNPLLVISTKRERGSASDPYNNSLGAYINVPLGSHSFAAPKLAEAEAVLTEMKVQELAAERTILLQQKQALQEVEKIETQLKLAKQSYKIAQQRLHLTQRAFELGESEFYLLLLAREQAAKAGLDLEKIQIEQQRAINRYNHSYGIIPE